MKREGFPYEVIQYEPGSEGRVLELLHSAMGDGAAGRFSPEYWRWKHHGNNSFGPSKGVYAWDEGEKRAAGLRIFMRWSFISANGEYVKAVRAVDTATHPDYRRKGIFSTLTKLAVRELKEEGVHFIFNTPNDKSLPGYLKMGWKVAGRVPMYVRALRPLRLVAAAFGRTAAGSPGGEPDWREFFTSNIISWRDFESSSKDELSELISVFEAKRRRVGYRTARSAEYMSWKYGGNPNAAYGVCPLYGGPGGLEGFAVLRPGRRFGLREAVLSEMVLRRPDAALGASLLREVIKNVKADYIVSHFQKGTFERKAAVRAGFLRIPHKGMTLAVRTLNTLPGGDDPERFENWDIGLGDLEVF